MSKNIPNCLFHVRMFELSKAILFFESGVSFFENRNEISKLKISKI